MRKTNRNALMDQGVLRKLRTIRLPRHFSKGVVWALSLLIVVVSFASGSPSASAAMTVTVKSEDINACNTSITDIRKQTWDWYVCIVNKLPAEFREPTELWDTGTNNMGNREECGKTDSPDDITCRTRNFARSTQMNETFESIRNSNEVQAPAYVYSNYLRRYYVAMQQELKRKDPNKYEKYQELKEKIESERVRIKPEFKTAKDITVKNTGTEQSTTSSVLNFIAKLLNWVLALLVGLLIMLINLELVIVEWLLGQANAVNTPWIISIWRAVRDFMNIFFILVLMIIAVANIVQYELDKYAIKTTLPKLLFAVVMVNFSKLICGLVLDFANVLEAGVYSIADIGPNGTGIVGSGCTGVATFAVKEGSLACKLAGTFSAAYKAEVQPVEGNAGQMTLFMANAFLFIILIMVVIGLVAIIILFLIRTLILWVLIATSPAMFAASVFPALEQFSSKWRDNFFKYAFMHVQFAFYMVIAVLAINGYVNTALGSPPQGGGLLRETAGKSVPWEVAGLDTNRFLQMIFMLAMVYLAVYDSVKSEHAPAIVGKIQEAGKGFGKWVASRSKYIPIPGPVKDAKTGKARLGWTSNAASYGKAAHTLLGAFKTASESKAEDYGDAGALMVAHGMQGGAKMIGNIPLVGRIGGKNGPLGKYADEIHQLTEVHGMQNTRKRAGELKEFYKQANKDDVMHMVMTTDRVDRLMLGLEVMAEAGTLEKADMMQIALGKGLMEYEHNGKKEDLTGRSQHEINEKLKELTPKELEENRDRAQRAISNYVGLKRFGQDMAQQSESARESRVGNWMRFAEQNKDRSTKLMFEFITKGAANGGENAAEYGEMLEGVIAYNLKDGKSDPDQVMAALILAMQKGILSPERVGALESKYLYRMPAIEYFKQSLFRNDGVVSKNPYEELNQVANIIESKGVDSNEFRQYIDKIHQTEGTQTRVDKMMSQLSPEMTDHDYFPYLMRYFSRKNAGYVTEKPNGRQRITDIGLANTYAVMSKIMPSFNDRGLLEALESMEKVDEDLFVNNWDVSYNSQNQLIDKNGQTINKADGQAYTRTEMQDVTTRKQAIIGAASENRLRERPDKVAKNVEFLKTKSVYGGTLGEARAILAHAIQAMNSKMNGRRVGQLNDSERKQYADEIRDILLQHQMLNFRGGLNPESDDEDTRENLSGSLTIKDKDELGGREGYSGRPGEGPTDKYKYLNITEALDAMSKQLAASGTNKSVEELRDEMNEEIAKSFKQGSSDIPQVLVDLFAKYADKKFKEDGSLKLQK